MKPSSNGAHPSAVLNDPSIDLAPLSSQEVWEELEAELAREMDLLPPAVLPREDTTPPDARPFAGMRPYDELSQEFQGLSEDILATVAAMRANLLSIIRDEFHSVYQEVLRVSRERDLPVSSAANLVADEMAGADDPARTQDPRYESTTPEFGNAVEADGARRSSFVQDRPRQPGTKSRPAHPPAQRPEARKSVLGAADSPGAAQNDVFEGTVRISVRVNGNVRQLLRFVDTLSKKAELRLLRLVGDHARGVDLWVGLRQPLRLFAELGKMEGLARVTNVLGARFQGPGEAHRPVSRRSARPGQRVAARSFRRGAAILPSPHRPERPPS